MPQRDGGGEQAKHEKGQRKVAEDEGDDVLH
jgi:hypothetical protein